MPTLKFSESTEIKDLYAERIPGGYQIAFFTFELTEEEQLIEETYRKYPALRPLPGKRVGASSQKKKPSTIPPIRTGKRWKQNRKQHRRIVNLVRRAYRDYSIPILRSIYIQNNLSDRDDYYFNVIEIL
ncbi:MULTISPECIES: hypothetical protein [Leptolyngbya]|nr:MULTISPECIES: hypothetical protein [Leptolyngbya]MBD2370778.1 hypothetical protein [Leptolyngbya sp. FACHB-161]MBD2377069.1 hypothetical protein [Leptolyngbya sp. FACHB-238]MBD2401512.1 hypothetical protein [Leptolyngbya sp. FACHB-239]MBD2408064.1 hypothetical protein [Leptolyngbya sp. FACHB-402]ULP29612.1 hypothetical protein MCP04_26880 [Leptolyngbya boryana IU 594]